MYDVSQKRFQLGKIEEHSKCLPCVLRKEQHSEIADMKGHGGRATFSVRTARALFRHLGLLLLMLPHSACRRLYQPSRLVPSSIPQ